MNRFHPVTHHETRGRAAARRAPVRSTIPLAAPDTAAVRGKLMALAVIVWVIQGAVIP